MARQEHASDGRHNDVQSQELDTKRTVDVPLRIPPPPLFSCIKVGDAGREMVNSGRNCRSIQAARFHFYSHALPCIRTFHLCGF